jgi:hypothetical protein
MLFSSKNQRGAWAAVAPRRSGGLRRFAVLPFKFNSRYDVLD